MKKLLKNTLLAVATIMASHAAGARELEYPSIPQGKEGNCGEIERANIAYYWKKKGLIHGSNDPKDYLTPSWEFKKSIKPIDGFVFAEFMLGEASDYRMGGDDACHAIAEWMRQDDNAGLSLTLLCPMAHGVAVESIREEEKRFILKICSWGKKFEIELLRPVGWIIKPGEFPEVRGRVLSGDPKDAKYLYDDETGGEKGPNRVSFSFCSFYSLLPKDILEKDFQTMLDHARRDEPLKPEKVHPFIGLRMPHDPLRPFVSAGILKDPYKKYPFLKEYVLKMKRIKQETTTKATACTSTNTSTSTTSGAGGGSPEKKTEAKTETDTETKNKNVRIYKKGDVVQ